MKKLDYKKIILDFLFVSVGCILLAFAITSILKPSGLITGGITGISLIVEKVTHIKYTYVYYVLSLLVLLSALLSLGRREAIKILLLSLSFPLILILFEKLNINFVENDLILASIYFGIIGGIGCGLILKRGFSQGGSDTIAKILHHKCFPFISVSQILLVIDTTIIFASAFVFQRNTALYAILTQVILIKSVDMVLFGLGAQKVKIEILSDENEKIETYILTSIKRGVSSYEVQGGYTKRSKLKIVSICSPREAMLIKRFIGKTDPNAFVAVIPVMSVWGEGIGFDSLLDGV